jgi:hypothetical protein
MIHRNRAYVTDKMLSHDSHFNQSKVWNVSQAIPTFSLILSSSAAKDGQKHVDHYLQKGLVRKLDGITELSKWLNVPVRELRNTFSHYIETASLGIDEWGKVSFRGLPGDDIDNETFYAGIVTPVLHYCMGGITIDVNGSVLNKEKEKIPGLYAVGEVTGGVHGDNRLGGNSLLECTVFGTIIGQAIPIKHQDIRQYPSPVTASPTEPTRKEVSWSLQGVSMSELSVHNVTSDCWVAIHGIVYQLTDFVEDHPGGPESIYSLCGKDGTKEFDSIHSKTIMDDFDDVKVGELL